MYIYIYTFIDYVLSSVMKIIHPQKQNNKKEVFTLINNSPLTNKHIILLTSKENILPLLKFYSYD